MSADPIRPRERFLVFGAPVIENAEIREAVASLESGWIGTGPKVAKFEEAFLAYKTASHGAAVSSCTAALHLSMLAAGIGPGDEVITTAMTFCSTVNAIVHAGATPVLADVDPRTGNIDPASVAARVTDSTRAILPVHFAGRPCDMDALLALGNEHGLAIIEDCAHAIETEVGSRKAGTLGDFGCFSFYATKNVTTAEGGFVVARKEEDAARIKRLALHGLSHDAWKRYGDEGYRHYTVVECGFKYNMTDLQAAIGIHQLERVDRSWERRREIWRAYDAELRDLPLELPPEPESDGRHAYHLYTVLIDGGLSRDEALVGMTREGIGVGVHYLSVPEHPYYAERFAWRVEDYPNAARIGRSTMSLPLTAGLTDEDVADVIAAVRRVLGA